MCGAAKWCLIVATTVLTASAQGELLVYESFDYTAGQNLKAQTPPIVAGMSGRSGMTGSWTAASNQGGGNGFRTTAGKLPVVSGPPNTALFDGSLLSMQFRGNYAGQDNISNGSTPGGTFADHLWASIGLDPSVTATFRDSTTTWMSCVVAADHYRWACFAFAIGSGVVDDSGAGLGQGASGPAIGIGSAGISRDGPTCFAASHWSNVLYSVSTEAPFVRDNSAFIVIARINWKPGGTPDEVLAAAFQDGARLTERAFNAAAVTNTVDFDQTAFTWLSVAGCRYSVDELRIGTMFIDVAPPLPSPWGGGMGLILR